MKIFSFLIIEICKTQNNMRIKIRDSDGKTISLIFLILYFKTKKTNESKNEIIEFLNEHF